MPLVRYRKVLILGYRAVGQWGGGGLTVGWGGKGL